MSQPIVIGVIIHPANSPTNPRPKEFIEIQSEGLSLDQVRQCLMKASDIVLVQLVTNTVKRNLTNEQEREPLVQIPGMMPPKDLRRQS